MKWPPANPGRFIRDFARIVAEEFKIDGLDGVDPPDSWRMLV
jgi:hypothetical protein